VNVICSEDAQNEFHSREMHKMNFIVVGIVADERCGIKDTTPFEIGITGRCA
jgi:hypothetical protein